MDTTLAHINMLVLGTNKVNEDSTRIEEVFGAHVFVQNISVDRIGFGNISDFKGKTDFYAEPGAYDLFITFIGYNTLIIKDLSLESGMAVDLKVVLGDGCGQNAFKVVSQNHVEEVITAPVGR